MQRIRLRRLLPAGAWPLTVVALTLAVLAATACLTPNPYAFSAVLAMSWLLYLPVRRALTWAPTPTRLDSRTLPAGEAAIGADGLLLGSARDPRFVSFDEITRARAEGPDRVRLSLANGKTMTLGCEDSDELEGAIVHRWQAFHRAEAAPREADRLRGDKSPRPRLGAGALTLGDPFRRPALRPEDAARVAVAPRVEASTRALAIRALDDAGPATRARLRVAIDETANPATRQVLERASSEGEAARRRTERGTD